MKFLERESLLWAKCGLGNTLSMFLRLVLLLVAAPLTTKALTLGQIDDFQDGTAENWGTGTGPATNVATGGPNGLGDNYLQFTSSGGSGNDSRMVVFNSSQWLGDYNGASITGIAMDLNNFSSQSLSLRIAFFESRTAGFVTTTPVSLGANSGWQHATFTLTSADFTAIGSAGDFNTLLSDFTGQLRILDSSSPLLQGDSISATLGIDNVQAIPEPNTFLMVGAGFLTLLAAAHTVRRQRFRRVPSTAS